MGWRCGGLLEAGRHGERCVGTQAEFTFARPAVSLPTDHVPWPVERFRVERIVLTKGSLDTRARRAFVRRICNAYPKVRTEEMLDVAHNRVDLAAADPRQRHLLGKRTLVFAAPNATSAVRVNQRPNAIFPYRQSFSVYGFCPYDCAYCYLAGSPGVWFSPTVKIYVNLPEILAQVDREAWRIGTRSVFCLGRFEDGLALDPLTAYSTVLIPFFAKHTYARLLVQTKSAYVERLLDLPHGGNTILSWSLNPPEISERYEINAPPVHERMAAMQRCAEAGYTVYANITPIIPHGDWEKVYMVFIARLVATVPLKQLILGEACVDTRGRALLEQTLGEDNAVSCNLESGGPAGSDWRFYTAGLCRRLLSRAADVVRRIRPCTTRYDTRHRRPHLVIEFR